MTNADKIIAEANSLAAQGLQPSVGISVGTGPKVGSIDLYRGGKWERVMSLPLPSFDGSVAALNAFIDG